MSIAVYIRHTAPDESKNILYHILIFRVIHEFKGYARLPAVLFFFFLFTADATLFAFLCGRFSNRTVFAIQSESLNAQTEAIYSICDLSPRTPSSVLSGYLISVKCEFIYEELLALLT